MDKGTQSFIRSSRRKHGDRYDYSLSVFEGPDEKITVICKVEGHGPFQQRASDHRTGSNCQKCGMVARKALLTDTKEEFVRKANFKHNSRYDYTNTEYKDTHKPVTVRCWDHGEFTHTACNHIAGLGCHDCIVFGRFTIKWLKAAIEILGDQYDYSDVGYIDDTTAIVKCRAHNNTVFVDMIDHLNGKDGCNQCIAANPPTAELFVPTRRTINVDHNILRQWSPKKLAQVKRVSNKWKVFAGRTHNSAYTYNKTFVVSRTDPVIITCEYHGDFLRTPDEHMNGLGCQMCSGTSCCTKEEFIVKAMNVHGTKYNYDDFEYIGVADKSIIRCPHHGNFKQMPNGHLNGNGCPGCAHLCATCKQAESMVKYCEHCSVKIGKNKTLEKVQEMEVVNLLREKILHIEMIHNRSVGSAVGGVRIYPDIRYVCAGYHLIIEIDERMHQGYSKERGVPRMHNIIKELKSPCVFIRYNPDHKDSDKYQLLALVLKYLNIEIPIWDSGGYYVEYMFY